MTLAIPGGTGFLALARRAVIEQSRAYKGDLPDPRVGRTGSGLGSVHDSSMGRPEGGGVG